MAQFINPLNTNRTMSFPLHYPACPYKTYWTYWTLSWCKATLLSCLKHPLDLETAINKMNEAEENTAHDACCPLDCEGPTHLQRFLFLSGREHAHKIKVNTEKLPVLMDCVKQDHFRYRYSPSQLHLGKFFCHLLIKYPSDTWYFPRDIPCCIIFYFWQSKMWNAFIIFSGSLPQSV